jgi:hypothetical protein
MHMNVMQNDSYLHTQQGVELHAMRCCTGTVITIGQQHNFNTNE